MVSSSQTSTVSRPSQEPQSPLQETLTGSSSQEQAESSIAPSPGIPDQPGTSTTESTSLLGPLVKTEDGSFTVQDRITGECYHTRMGARREAEELYIKLSGFHDALARLPATCINVLDVGLGLGYNAASTLEAWLRAPCPPSVLMVSLENNVEVIQSLLKMNAPWTQTWDTRALRALATMTPSGPGQWSCRLSHPSSKGDDRESLEGSTTNPVFVWEIFALDAVSEPLPYARESAPTEKAPPQRYPLAKNPGETSFFWDFVWQDPFSPDRNPAMWSSHWFKKLRQQCHPDTRVLTYSVARRVRDALEEAGFTWEKRPTPFPMKKHWLYATPQPASSL